MSLTSEESSISYVGNNSTSTPYPIPFLFYAVEDISVIVTDDEGVETTLTPITDYAVIGGDAEAGATGSLTTTAAIPATSAVLVERTVEMVQDTTFTDIGKFPSISLTRALDYLTMICQQLYRNFTSFVSTLFATDEETIEGTLTDKATTPHGVAAVIAQAVFNSGSYVIATLSQVKEGISNIVIVSPLGLRASLEGSVVDIRWFGAVCDGVTDDTEAINDASDYAANTNASLLIPGPCSIQGACPIAAPVVDCDKLLFAITGAGSLSFYGGATVRPEWFGDVTVTKTNATREEAPIRQAVTALPNGGTVLFRYRTYAWSGFGYILAPGETEVTPALIYMMNQDNISWIGEKLPVNINDEELADGTLIQGPCYVWANNFYTDKIGYDSGQTVCDDKFLGASQEGFLATYPAERVYPEEKENLRVGDIIAICVVGALVHATLFEAYNVVIASGTIYSVGANFGTAIKCRNFIFPSIRNDFVSGVGCIIKSDSRALCSLGWIGSVRVDRSPAIALQFFSQDSRVVDSVTVDCLEAIQSPGGNEGLVFDGILGSLSSCRVNSALVNGYNKSLNMVGILSRCEVGTLTSISSVDAVTAAQTSGTPLTLGQLTVSAKTGITVNLSSASIMTVAQITEGDTVSGSAYSLAGTSRLYVGGANLVSTSFAAITLQNSWANSGAGNSTFSITLNSNRVFLTGHVKSGSSWFVNPLPANLRPIANTRVLAMYYNGPGNTASAVSMVIASTGEFGCEVVPDMSNAASYICLDGISWSTK